MNIAIAAFGATGVHGLLRRRSNAVRRLGSIPKSFAVLAILGAITILAVGLQRGRWIARSYFSSPAAVPAALNSTYRPELFVVDDARGPAADGHGGVDDLITVMGVYDLKLHRSDTLGMSSGPHGLIDADDVVLVKVNAQWPERGGTNTDVLRGLLRRIVEHPDGFTGEIVVADNGQSRGDLNRAASNAENPEQSVQVVTNDFAAEGWTVSAFLWDAIRLNSVEEFAAPDLNDGFVVGSTDPQTGIKPSYPKFRSAAGTCISYKFGIWSPTAQSYDRDKLVVVNLPVLKTHANYGVTASVKNHMGVVSQGLGTDSHWSVGRGGMGTLLADVRTPDLNILDCIWVLARPTEGPAAPYDRASFRNLLVAGRDPVALDMWAVKHVLIPQMIANGYTAAAYRAQDPDNLAGAFRNYIDRSMSEMRIGGIETTNDYASVQLRRWVGDTDRDGDVDLFDFQTFIECLSGPLFSIGPACMPVDLNGDARISLPDFQLIQQAFTDSLH